MPVLLTEKIHLLTLLPPFLVWDVRTEGSSTMNEEGIKSILSYFDQFLCT